MTKKIWIIAFLFFFLISCSVHSYYSAANDGLLLRKLPGTHSEIIKVIPFGEKLEVIDKNGPEETINSIPSAWMKIGYDGKTGWVFGGYVFDSNEKVYFGYTDGQDGRGNPLFGYYSSGKFTNIYQGKMTNEEQQKITKNYLANYQLNTPYAAFTPSGKKIIVEITNRHESMEGLGAALFETKNNVTEYEHALFFSTKNLIKFPEMKVITLSDQVVSSLRTEIRRMLDQNQETSLDIVLDYSISRIDAKEIKLRDGKSIIVAVVPLNLRLKNGPSRYLSAPSDLQATLKEQVFEDQRASSYFILNKEMKILFSSFGHPEWGPNALFIRQIEPVLYFYLPDYPRLLCFAHIFSGWEIASYVIMNAENGDLLTY